ncbi:hypothetical protein CS8_097610 [Cupriavidus sp. 8B]
MREIGYVQDAVDQRQAQRNQAVYAAQRQAVQDLLKKQCHGLTSCDFFESRTKARKPRCGLRGIGGAAQKNAGPLGQAA